MAQGNVKPIPEGYHTVTPHLVLDDCASAIEFYKRAFGAEELARMNGPGGKIVHAEIRIGDSILMLADEMPAMPGQPVYRSPRSAGLATASLFLYVNDVDAAFERAVKAGCTVGHPVTEMFWGDRFGQVIDPFGHSWSLATHIEDVPEQEMRRRHDEFVAQMAEHMPPAGGGRKKARKSPVRSAKSAAKSATRKSAKKSTRSVSARKLGATKKKKSKARR